MSNLSSIKSFIALGTVVLALAACGPNDAPHPAAQSTAPAVTPTVSAAPASSAPTPVASPSRSVKPKTGSRGDQCPYSQDKIESIVDADLEIIPEMTGPFHVTEQPDPSCRCAWDNESAKVRVVIVTSEYPKGSRQLARYIERQDPIMRHVELDGHRVMGGVSDITAIADYRQDTATHSYYVSLYILRGNNLPNDRALAQLEELFNYVNATRFGR